jgi:hypothetical protein
MVARNAKQGWGLLNGLKKAKIIEGKISQMKQHMRV